MATMSCGLFDIKPDRLEILLQIIVELVDDAADMGVPLADVDCISVGRRAGERPTAMLPPAPPTFSMTTGCPSARTHVLGNNARGDIGRSARRERNDERDLT